MISRPRLRITSAAISGIVALSLSASQATAQVTSRATPQGTSVAQPSPSAAAGTTTRAKSAEDYLRFYQNPWFDYLTGIREPGAALVMVRRGGDVKSFLLVEPRDASREVWSGFRLGADGAEKRSGIPSRLAKELPALLESMLGPTDTLWVAGTAADDPTVASLVADRPSLVVRRADRAIRAARAFKSEAEIALIRQAIDITVLAHQQAMQVIEPGMNEFEVQALIEYTFRRNGADRPSFASIVGSGPNATTLHYNANDRFMNSGDMLVMDIGASYRGYAADVTRSVPVNGKFSPDQRAVYTIVREAQKAAERQATVGTSWRVVSDSARGVIAEGLARLGLVDSADAQYECAPGRSCSQVALYYMHGLGHGIGLDVHDPDRHELTGALAVGSIFTIEPGIYVRANLLEVIPDTPANAALRARLRTTVPRFANIGVRIEDDYVVTANGLEWLSRGAPREIDEIEALMRKPYTGPAARDASLVERYRD